MKLLNKIYFKFLKETFIKATYLKKKKKENTSCLENIILTISKQFLIIKLEKAIYKILLSSQYKGKLYFFIL